MTATATKTRAKATARTKGGASKGRTKASGGGASGKRPAKKRERGSPNHPGPAGPVAAERPAGVPFVPAFDDALDLPVDFGQVSIGDATAKIGFSVPRTRLNIDVADGLLCGRRLQLRALVVPAGDDPRQTYLLGDIKHSLEGAADVKGFRVTPKLIAAGLTFALGDIDVGELGHFAKRSGRLIVSSAVPLAAANGEVGGDPEDDEDEEDEDNSDADDDAESGDTEGI